MVPAFLCVAFTNGSRPFLILCPFGISIDILELSGVFTCLTHSIILCMFSIFFYFYFFLLFVLVTIISEAQVGARANNHRSTLDRSKLVTWSDDHKDRTLRFWNHDRERMEILGSFTPDKQVCSRLLPSWLQCDSIRACYLQN